MLLVYFSSATENTRRFVDKLSLPSARIPLHRADKPLRVREPYILVCPTYGGGASLNHDNVRPVPPQVIRFLNDVDNRNLIRGVIAGGNSNFGPDFGRAGDLISEKTGAPYLYRFELMGTDYDVEHVRDALIDQAAALGLSPLAAEEERRLRERIRIHENESAARLARLRERYQAV